MRRVIWLLALAACGGGDDDDTPAIDAGPASPDAPIVLPDQREACASSDPLRQPFFGDLHVHTSYSFDAVADGTRARPEDAYAFAKGQPLGLPPFDDQGQPSRTRTLDRPLDFLAVTDHADLFAETELCNDPGSAAYDTNTCVDYRDADLFGEDMEVTGLAAILAAISPRHADFCADNDCPAVSRDVWRRTQDAAEAAYDRTAACTFTSFVGYEWTAAPLGNNLHRNVIFANRQVPALPIGYVEASWKEELWRQLEAACTGAGTGCDVLLIPHNSNLSGGQMFVPLSESAAPFTADEAARRSALEPLVEIFQHKGSSECMIGFGDPLGAEDELCRFENVHRPLCTGAPTDPDDCTPLCSEQAGVGFRAECADSADFVRTGLGAGLIEQARIGANPFQLGFVGGSDSHLSTAGAVEEDRFVGHLGGSDATLAGRLAGVHPLSNPGALTVVWAEENSRESLFAALRRRETYATSGPRMVVRLFGGWSYDADLCGDAGLVAAGYDGGVPMGGVLPAAPGADPPRFVIQAARDPDGAPLQRVQIVKGWVDGGAARYQVYEAAGDPANGAGVDPATCAPTGDGFDLLCQVWIDPDFDPAAPAFYYARVVENPTCRWTARQCLEAAVDCESQPAGDPLAACCDPDLPRTVQERAWSSPIWYVPPP